MTDSDYDKLVKQCMSHAVHEMRTSIQILSGYLEILDAQTFTPEKKHILLQETRHLSKLLQKLLRLYKTHETNQRADLLELEDLDLVSVIKEIFTLFEQKNKHHDFKLIIHPEIPDELICYWDVQETEAMLRTLLENAFKYTPKHNKITLGLEMLPDEQVKIWVHNEGVGIPKEHHQNIFHPFFRLDKQKKGTGLGLSIAGEIAKLHQGRVLLESDENSFTKFNVHLPKRPDFSV